MITYICPKCGFDFARTEAEKPVCFYCDNTQGHKIVSKKKLTPEVIAERLRITSNRMMENLKKAWEVRPKEIREDPQEEGQMLELLGKAKKLRDKTQEVMRKVVKKSEKDKKSRDKK